jgi:1-acyl-sn-glycerol-3-phosphate acyltransferase
MRTTRYFISTLLIIFITALLSLGCVLGIVIFRLSVPKQRIFTETWANWIVKIAGLKVTVFGMENINLDQAYIVTSNHQSNLDIPISFYFFPTDLRMVAKKELLRIPIFGQVLRLGQFITIDRSKPKKAIQDLLKAKEKLQSGISRLD